MKNKKNFNSVFAFLLVLSGIISLSGCKIGVQEVVTNQYENKNGLIQNYAGDPKKQNIEYLSESIGQYMVYLLLVKDEKEFNHQVTSLNEHFIVEKDGQVFIKWKATKSIVANASIDDFRIIESLKKASKAFNEPSYLTLADQLEKTILSTQLTNGLVVDFYDWKLKEKTTSIHLSYLNNQIIKENKALDGTLYQKIIVESPGSDSPFFNEVYDVDEKNYQTTNDESVNMIDQLLIAINYVKLTNQLPKNFDRWLRSEWNGEKKLAGGYNKKTLSPSVSYESSAVYSLAVLYFMTIKETEYATQLHTTVMKHSLFDSKANYSNIHFFDYMWAKTSDWKYENEY